LASGIDTGCVIPVGDVLSSQLLVWMSYCDPVGVVLHELLLP
jgi:hypothetical protein